MRVVNLLVAHWLNWGYGERRRTTNFSLLSLLVRSSSRAHFAFASVWARHRDRRTFISAPSERQLGDRTVAAFSDRFCRIEQDASVQEGDQRRITSFYQTSVDRTPPIHFSVPRTAQEGGSNGQ